MTAEPLTTCRMPGCDGKVRRLVSGGAGFLLKGSGFYATDYRSESYKKAAKADSAPTVSSSSSDGKSSSGTKSSPPTSSSSSS